MTLVTFAASSNAQFPYNPDSDGNGAIQLNDLLDFVQLYGTDFILPVMDPSIQVLDSELLAQVDTISIGGGISIQLFLPVTVEDESDILLFKNTELHDGLGVYAQNHANIDLQIYAFLPEVDHFKRLMVAIEADESSYNGSSIWLHIIDPDGLTVSEFHANNISENEMRMVWSLDGTWFSGSN